ncbi:MAG: SurA N-terminal domain-containing protein [Bacteriovoracaceae bacterium]
MRNTVANKMSYFILSFLFLIIIASFIFTGFDGGISMGGPSSNEVASVDGTPITTREYQTALNRQVEFFNQMMGGNLTQAQLEQMGIKRTVLDSLIQQKLMLNAAEKMGFVISLEEVKEEIKKLPYFQTNGQFDVSLYRNMLQSNGYVPARFEELIADDMKQQKLEGLFTNLIVSDNSVADIVKFKNSVIAVQGVRIPRQSLTPLISVTDAEIKEFASKEENKAQLESLYEEDFALYNKPEEIKARHILIRGEDDKALEKAKKIRSGLTAKNFNRTANKETEDESGKDNGGDLGWFAKGRMVPEFEEEAFKLKKGQISDPVKTSFGYHIILVEDKRAAQVRTLDQVKNELAKKALQKSKSTDLDALLQSQHKAISEALAKNNFKTVENIASKVNGTYINTEINQYDQSIDQTQLSNQEANKLFSANPGDLVDLGNPGNIYLVKVVSKTQKASGNEARALEKTTQEQLLSRKTRSELLRVMNNKAKVVTNPALL